MSRQVEWARLTPYEVGIPGRAFVDRSFTAIREEAAAREVDPSDPGAFILLGEVGRALREIQGEERGGEAIQRYGALLFHAYHFHRAGERILLMETKLARRLVEDPEPTGTGGTGALPGEAGYLQLPRHLFWAGAAPKGGPSEPLDGIFWTRTAGETLSLLVALGVRRDRPGISVMELPPVPLADAPRWATEPAREEGEDFATILPGGELDRLYSVVVLGEVLKLVSRLFLYLEAFPEALGEEERSPRPAGEARDPAVPPPSLLPFRRIRPPPRTGNGPPGGSGVDR